MCGYFQHQLRVRVDLVTDFDHGLKAVFEQRPSVVCIQEQIANVTGESVARHIQMLLGADAPAFILLHEGNNNVKPVPRLFEQLVDLSAAFEQVCDHLSHALQQLLPNYRELISPLTLPVAEKGKRAAACGEETVSEQASEAPEDVFGKQTSVDDFSNLFETTAIGGPPAETASSVVVRHTPSAFPDGTEYPPAPAAVQQPEPVPYTPMQPPGDPVAVPAASAAAPASAADDDHVPVEALLQAVEDNYLRRKRWLQACLVVGLVLIVAVLAWWFRPRAASMSGTPGSPPPVPAAVTAPQQAVQLSPSSAAQPPSPSRQEPLPSFVVTARRDHDFETVQPGWSRFVTDHREYRLFHEHNRLQAVQVLARGGSGITAAEIRQVLQEVSGDDRYQVQQQARKQGAWVEDAVARNGKAGLLIYRTVPHGPVSAFVIARKP